MAQLVSAVLAKNEADRYLKRVLERLLAISDTVLLLDDRSSDNTPKIAKQMGVQVRGRSVLKDPAWGHEAPARSELWEWASQEAGEGWVLFCDADMVMVGDPRPLTQTWEANAWAFILYDVWNEQETAYRHDGFWQGHLHPRPWMVRPGAVQGDLKAFWGRPGMHVGHIPPNFPLQVAIAPPDEYFWLHLAYCRDSDRKVKAAQYREVSHLLTDFEKAHAESILT